MGTTPEMIDSLASNITTLCPIWKITSRDGVVAAYCAHTRNTVGRLMNGASPFVFNGVTYKTSAAQPTRSMSKIGLSPNSTQISGFFDDLITREDVESGRWKLARVVLETVNYLDLSLGSTDILDGFTGKWSPYGNAYQVEVLSKATLLAQQIGEQTSPTDRNPFPAGLDKAAWTITRGVVSSADRRHLVINGAVPDDHYYKYGVIKWLSGGNTHILGMEIKDNVGAAIELQLPVPRDIIAGDSVSLLAGYDGTREQARDKFDDMINFNGEPDLPGLKVIFTYPE